MSTELSIRPDQTQFDSNQLAALRSLGVNNASDADVALFFHQAARTGLDPFARQIYLINRGGKQTIQVGIDGFRLIRDRKGTYRGHTEEWCGTDGKWRDVWLGREHPSAARVQVYVAGYTVPVVGIATWDEYAAIGRDGKPQSVWASKPALMLAKCAEALALRKAFPQDLSGLYTTDEIPEAEQDHDGVYVTTTMRGDSRPEQPHNRKSGHATGTEVKTRPVGKSSPDSGRGPGRPRTDPVAGTADQTADIRDRVAVAEDWITRVRAIDDLGLLYKAHDDAATRNVLDHTDGLETVEDAFLTRRTELQQAAAREGKPIIPVDDEAVYPDDESVPF